MDSTTQMTRPKVNTLRYSMGRLVRGHSFSAAAGQPVGLGNRLFKPASAQALVEFVLVSLPMMALFIGLFEFGIVFYVNGKLEAATREVARATAICGNGCDYDQTRQLSGPDISGLEMIWYANNPSANTTPPVLSNSNNYLIDPKNIRYIWMQRLGSDGQLDTTTQVEIGYDPANPNNPPKATYPEIYNLYIFDPGGSPYAPFKSVPYTSLPDPKPTTTKAATTNGGAGIGWPSAGYNTTPTGGIRYYGRSICEPTHRFWVEIAYNHQWVTPINYLPGLSQPIVLKSRRIFKGEPVQFQPGAGSVCVSN